MSTLFATLTFALATIAPLAANVPQTADYAVPMGGAHQVDVYAPAGARNAPVLVWFFGGGRSSGNRKQFAALGRALANEGVVFVAPGYQIRTPATPAVTARTIAADAGMAIAWTQAHIARYGGDPRSIVVGGYSAGAQVAALAVLDQHYIRDAGGDPRAIAGAFIMSGVLDVRPIPAGAPPAWTHDFGASEDDRWQLSPLKYARADAPPFEVSCAEHDPPRFPTPRDPFVARMRALGASVTTFTEENATHGTEFTRVMLPDDPLHQEILAFVKAHAAPRAGTK